MRTIKASEVRKGMRVRVERERGKAIVTVEGPADHDFSLGAWPIAIDSQPVNVDPDHPVTVLAEPEPEWVEGAWYWVEANVNGSRDMTPMRRVDGGWSRWVDLDSTFFFDGDVTVLGRVLIVDWPGDAVAEGACRAWPEGQATHGLLAHIVKNAADAIRTQGGTR